MKTILKTFVWVVQFMLMLPETNKMRTGRGTGLPVTCFPYTLPPHPHGHQEGTKRKRIWTSPLTQLSFLFEWIFKFYPQHQCPLLEVKVLSCIALLSLKNVLKMLTSFQKTENGKGTSHNLQRYTIIWDEIAVPTDSNEESIGIIGALTLGQYRASICLQQKVLKSNNASAQENAPSWIV